MNRMRLAVAVAALGVLTSVASPAGASEHPPLLLSAPKATLGASVTITGLFFQGNRPATLYLEAGKTRKRLAVKKVAVGGQFTMHVRLPRSAPKNAHLLACQNKCKSRTRLALTH